MRQFLNIAVNAFMELLRQPMFLLVLSGSVLFEIFLAVPYYFGFGDKLTAKTANGEFSARTAEPHDAWWNSIARAMA